MWQRLFFCLVMVISWIISWDIWFIHPYHSGLLHRKFWKKLTINKRCMTPYDIANQQCVMYMIYPNMLVIITSSNFLQVFQNVNKNRVLSITLKVLHSAGFFTGDSLQMISELGKKQKIHTSCDASHLLYLCELILLSHKQRHFIEVLLVRTDQAVSSSSWLLTTWHHLGARPSVITIMLTQLLLSHHMNYILITLQVLNHVWEMSEGWHPTTFFVIDRFIFA